MLSFLQHCRELITEDVIRRLLAPLECTLTMLAQYVQIGFKVNHSNQDLFCDSDYFIHRTAVL